MSEGSPDPMAVLDRYGPGQSGSCGLEEARGYVRRLTLSHYENFSVLSRLVPEGLRDDFAAVYAFCRWADDLGDETGVGEAARARSLELLAWWRRELTVCFAHARDAEEAPPRNPVFVALAETARRRGLDEGPFHDLIDAFEQDQRVTRYGTWDELVDYCRRSADPVGRIVLRLAGVGPNHAGAGELQRMSDATCTALQLTNFWQDVRRDLVERDRVYLPSAEVGFGAEELRAWLDRGDDPAVRVRYIRAVRPLVERTRELFREGRGLPVRVGGSMAPVIWLFGAGGERVLREVERSGCATLWRRPRLSKSAKAGLVLRAWVLRPGARG